MMNPVSWLHFGLEFGTYLNHDDNVPQIEFWSDEKVDIRTKRTAIKLSQSKLSELTGINQAKISAHELGKNALSDQEIEIINKLINELDANAISTISKKRYSKVDDGASIINSRNRRSYAKTGRNEEYLEKLREISENFCQPLSEKSPKALSFFAGCGGLCYGMKAAGFNIVGTNELVDGFRQIYKLNFPDTNFLPNDIKNITDSDLEQFEDIDLLIGGPPCQGFSLAGKRDVNDERNSLFEYYLKIADKIQPKVIVMENVRVLTSMKDSDGFFVKDKILDVFEEHGYISNFFEVNAKNYGAPQHRERVFFIGIRKDLNRAPSFPDPEYLDDEDLFTKRPFSFGDAVSDLPFIESGESSSIEYHKAVKHPEHVLRWLVDVPEGKSAHENEDENLRPPSGYNTTYKRQVWDEPASTVATTFAMISGCRNVHPVATRSTTVKEALRLQSFPDTFRLTGKQGDITTTIGNAVPPLLAYAIGKHLMKTYIL